MKLISDSKDIRIDKFINEKSFLSRNKIHRLIKENKIKVNGKKIKKNYILEEFDEIIIDLLEEKEIIKAQNIDIDVVYEDEWIAIINKGKNMVVHPDSNHKTNTLVNALMYRFKKLSDLDGDKRLGIIHRMDKDTTGLLVIAKDNVTHKYYQDLFFNHEIVRKYRALVHGRLKEDLIIDKPIGRDKKNRLIRNIDYEGRKAITNVKVIKLYEEYTLVDCYLKTGRTHQIRVHLKSINHPIVGDKSYGLKKEKFNLDSQLLHAQLLGFYHYKKKKHMEFTSDIPCEFKRIIDILK